MCHIQITWSYKIYITFGAGDMNDVDVIHPFLVASIPEMVMPSIAMGAILGGNAAPQPESMDDLPMVIPMAAVTAVPLDTIAAADLDKIVWAPRVLPVGSEGSESTVICKSVRDSKGTPCNNLVYTPTFPTVSLPKLGNANGPEQLKIPVQAL